MVDSMPGCIFPFKVESFFCLLDDRVSMYLLYLDESGDYNNWAENKNFALGGFAIHEGQIEGIASQMDDIQSKLFPLIQTMVPFHATDIYSGRGLFKDLERGSRIDLLKELYEVVRSTAFPKIILYATDLDVTKSQTPTSDLGTVFSDVAIRFNSFLNRQFDRNHPNKGLIVIDQAHEPRYRDLFREYKTQGLAYGSVRHLVDIPYFARSKETRMIQLADLCVYAVFRKYERGDSTFFDIIKEKFDRRSGSDVIDGLRHLTKNVCTCESCISRR